MDKPSGRPRLPVELTAVAAHPSKGKRPDAYLQQDRERSRRRAAERRAYLHAVKAAAGCAICGDRDPYALEFHHRPGTVKVANVATLAHSGSWRAALVEVDKCVVLCASCHRSVKAGTVADPSA